MKKVEHFKLHLAKQALIQYQNQRTLKCKENYNPTSLINTEAIISNKIRANRIHSTLKISFTMIKHDLSLKYNDGLIYIIQ